MAYRHVPVMLKEVLEYLDPKSGQFFIDCTLGGAGYTMALANSVGPKGKVLAIDLDKMAIDNAKELIAKKGLKNIILENDNFKNLSKIVRKYFEQEQENQFDGVVLDLGLSSAQLEDGNRGFSFKLAKPLNMAFGPKEENFTTYEIVNGWKENDLRRIIRDYGEEKFAGRIAAAIARERKNTPINTTEDLVKIIEKAVPMKYVKGKIHSATRTFQALRIATNDELKNLEEVLPVALESLKKGGRLAVVSFHSLEDRIVKNFFREEAKDCVCPPALPICQCDHRAKLKIITKKIVIPGEAEEKNNPRSRSAKLRVAEKI
ncbi:MAG: 16S rRNA (cytosine(1402)-N(4))-methyltransferase RsmH [Patescibacteria group bacterium]|jgi:16S rRNA (cytosine1402-N4)-methyltransferase